LRRPLTNAAACVATLLLLAGATAGNAVAYFTATGAGSSQPATISTLSQPSILAATPDAGGTVTLTWATVTPLDSHSVTYKVERDGGNAAGTCVSTLSATTCVDAGLDPGTYEYTVTAKWRSWTVTGASKSATVAVGPVDHLALSASSLTPTAGAADNLTIVAKDEGGGTVTSYDGSHSLIFSGANASPNGIAPTVSDSSGAAVPFGEATAIDFDDGVATVTAAKNGAMKLYRNGAAGIAVSDGTVSTKAPLTVTVSPAAASKFALAAESPAPAAGATDNLTITVKDAYGNLATSYSGSHSLTFSGASASPGGNTPTVASSAGTAVSFGSATALSFTAGVATASAGKNGAMKLYRAGEADIEAKEGSIGTEAPLELTVSPGAATKFALTASTTTPAAGAVDNLTTTAQDVYGNTATSYAGARSLTFSGASASPSGKAPTISDSGGSDVTFGTATAIEFSAGVASVSGERNGAMKLYKGGSTSLKVTDGSLTTPTALTVTVGTTATRFLLAAATSAPAAGASDNLTITALDAYENTATSYTGSHSLTFSGASASPSGTKPTVANASGTATAFGTATAITFTSGVAAVTSSKNGLMKIYASGVASVEVSDGSIATQTPLTVTVSPGEASKFVLSATSTTPAVGETDNLTTTAQDTYGNVATAYTGARSLTFSGAAASPSGVAPTVSDSAGADVAFGSATTIEFTAGIAAASGTKNGVTKLYKSGSTSLKATDGTLTTPTALVVTVAAGAAVKFAFTASATSLAAGGSSNLTTTAQDSYGNTATAYTGAHNLTFSGATASPNATAPTVANSSGTATAFGTATALTFTSGVASVTSSKNGLMKLYRAESASVSVSDGSISSAAPVAVTVTPTTVTRWALTNIVVSAGSLGSNCLFTCTLTGLGNSGTVKARVAATDAYGNTVSNIGSSHAAKVTTSGSGTISGTPLAIPASGTAESATSFTFTSKSSGSFTETLTVAASEGTAYTTATLTASK
jgi:hypothetical protein